MAAVRLQSAVTTAPDGHAGAQSAYIAIRCASAAIPATATTAVSACGPARSLTTGRSAAAYSSPRASLTRMRRSVCAASAPDATTSTPRPSSPGDGTNVADTRTDEQRAADEALTAAIARSMQAYEWTDGLLTDYVIVTVQQSFTDDGDMGTSTGLLYRDNGLPYYRILGLLQVARLQAEHGFRTEEDVS